MTVLSDVQLGTLGLVAIGTSGTKIPTLNAANTWGGLQTFSAGIAFANETLSTYDEVTFTPSIGATGTNGTHTYSSQTGRAIKVGKSVMFAFNIVLTAKDATISGNLKVRGLPFTEVNADPSGAAVVSAWKFDLSAGYTYVGTSFDNTGTAFGLYECGDNVSYQNLIATSLLATTTCYGFGYYEAAS